VYELAILLAAAGYGVYRLVRAQAEARRYLEDAGKERPLEVGHLSGALARVAQETRTLRIALESTVRGVRQALGVDPTRTIDDIEALDAALMEATRAIGEWLAMIDALPAMERGHLGDLGGDPAPVRAAMEAERWSLERSRLREAGRPTLDLRIERIIHELTRIEGALQTSSRVYR